MIADDEVFESDCVAILFASTANDGGWSILHRVPTPNFGQEYFA
jgi:hypothetical protein